MEVDLPPLAQYLDRKKYSPQYGDYVVWSGWITTWHGVVTNFDPESNEISIVFSGVPYLLFNFTDEEQESETKKVKLSKIRTSSNGTFAIQRQNQNPPSAVWYI